MARIITKDDESHPSHPAYKKSHADVVAAEKSLKAESEKDVAAEKAEKTIKVPERKTE